MVGAGRTAQGGITTVENLILEYVPPDLKIRQLPTYGAHSFPLNLLIYATTLIRLFGILVFRKTDLLHVHFAERGSTIRKLLVVSLARCFRMPYILHSHGAAYEQYYDRTSSVFKAIVKNSFHDCTKFIALSKSWAEYYQDSFGLTEYQMEILKNPVELPSSVPDRSRHQDVHFLFMGHIGERGGPLDRLGPMACHVRQNKGAFDLIQAFANLTPEDRTRARLTLAGSGQTGQAAKLAAELGVGDAVCIKEWVNKDERNQLLGKADVFVLPSYHEGLPMSLLEAMANGLPPLTTPVGGIPEAVTDGQNGLLTPPGDIDALSRKMRLLIRDESLRVMLGKAARVTAFQFDIRSYVNTLARIYQDAAGK